MPYSEVLIAVEPNDEAFAIVEKAKAFAPKANLSVVAVIPDVVHAYGSAWSMETSGLMVEFLEGARKQAKERLRNIARAFDISEDRVYVRTGRPATAVHELAEQLDADCVVAGSHGQHGLALVLGSTANALIHGLECDAFFIRLDEP